jgi:nucleotide-binding universal stress UspA family protein
MTRLFQRILVGVDSTESSMAAGKLAVELASEHRADLTLVYVVNDDLARELSLALGQPEDQVRRDLETNGRRYLGEIGRLAEAAGVAAEQVVRRGSPPVELIAEARARGDPPRLGKDQRSAHPPARAGPRSAARFGVRRSPRPRRAPAVRGGDQ